MNDWDSYWDEPRERDGARKVFVISADEQDVTVAERKRARESREAKLPASSRSRSMDKKPGSTRMSAASAARAFMHQDSAASIDVPFATEDSEAEGEGGGLTMQMEENPSYRGSRGSNAELEEAQASTPSPRRRSWWP